MATDEQKESIVIESRTLYVTDNFWGQRNIREFCMLDMTGLKRNLMNSR